MLHKLARSIYFTVTGDYLYWSDGMMHTVNRFDLKTQTSKQILPDNGNSQYMDIAFDGGYLYLLDWTVPK